MQSIDPHNNGYVLAHGQLPPSQAATPASVEADIHIMLKGSQFMKYNTAMSITQPHPINLWYERGHKEDIDRYYVGGKKQDTGKLIWNNAKTMSDRSYSSKNMLRVRDITDIYEGKRTETFLNRRAAAKVPEEQCFSLVTKNKTMDLSTPRKEHRDAFLAGIRYLLLAQGVNVHLFKGSGYGSRTQSVMDMNGSELGANGAGGAGNGFKAKATPQLPERPKASAAPSSERKSVHHRCKLQFDQLKSAFMGELEERSKEMKRLEAEIAKLQHQISQEKDHRHHDADNISTLTKDLEAQQRYKRALEDEASQFRSLLEDSVAHDLETSETNAEYISGERKLNRRKSEQGLYWRPLYSQWLKRYMAQTEALRDQLADKDRMLSEAKDREHLGAQAAELQLQTKLGEREDEVAALKRRIAELEMQVSECKEETKAEREKTLKARSAADLASKAARTASDAAKRASEEAARVKAELEALKAEGVQLRKEARDMTDSTLQENERLKNEIELLRKGLHAVQESLHLEQSQSKEALANAAARRERLKQELNEAKKAQDDNLEGQLQLSKNRLASLHVEFGRTKEEKQKEIEKLRALLISTQKELDEERGAGESRTKLIGEAQRAFRALRPWVGIRIVKADFEVDYQDGVTVVSTAFGGPAHGAGIMPGDIIENANGQPTPCNKDFAATIKSVLPGDTVSFQIQGEHLQMRNVSIDIASRGVSFQDVTQVRRIASGIVVPGDLALMESGHFQQLFEAGSKKSPKQNLSRSPFPLIDPENTLHAKGKLSGSPHGIQKLTFEEDDGQEEPTAC